MGVILGIDGGGTKTRCLVAGRDGGPVLGEGVAGPSNFQAVGVETAVANVKAAVEMALAAANATLADVEAACAGLAGVGRPEDQATMAEGLACLGLPRLQVVTDARIALAGALGGRPGVVVIAGTGSIAYGIDAEGRTYRAGGWGWILGDEGSGFDIGRRALAAALSAFDGAGPETLLAERICTAWGLERIDQAVRLVYSDVVEARGRLAALVPLVVDAAAEGDAVATQLLQEAGRSLAALAAAVVRRMNLPAAIDPLVAMAGGVLSGVPLVQQAMREALAALAPSARLVPSMGEPADGALLLAREMLAGM